MDWLQKKDNTEKAQNSGIDLQGLTEAQIAAFGEVLSRRPTGVINATSLNSTGPTLEALVKKGYLYRKGEPTYGTYKFISCYYGVAKIETETKMDSQERENREQESQDRALEDMAIKAHRANLIQDGNDTPPAPPPPSICHCGVKATGWHDRRPYCLHHHLELMALLEDHEEVMLEVDGALWGVQRQILEAVKDEAATPGATRLDDTQAARLHIEAVYQRQQEEEAAARGVQRQILEAEAIRAEKAAAGLEKMRENRKAWELSDCAHGIPLNFYCQECDDPRSVPEEEPRLKVGDRVCFINDEIELVRATVSSVRFEKIWRDGGWRWASEPASIVLTVEVEPVGPIVKIEV